MNPDNSNEMVATLSTDPVVKQPHPVLQVTPLSKYLAMVLFIVLPFVGGYVGYQLAINSGADSNPHMISTGSSEVASQENLQSETLYYFTSYDDVIEYISSTTDPHIDWKTKANDKLQVIENVTFVDPTIYENIEKFSQYFLLVASTSDELTFSRGSLIKGGEPIGIFKFDKSNNSLIKMSDSPTDSNILDNVIVDEITAYECTSEVNPYPHQCFRYISNTSAQEISNLTEEAKLQGVIGGRTALGELMYRALDSSKMYFTAGIPESDGCCRLIAFDTDTLKFDIIEAYQGLGKSFSSKDKRYIATVENDTSVYILDLEIEEIIQRKNITSGSLMSSKCGFAGPVYDVTFNEDKKGFDFGVYGPDTTPDNECKQEKISEGFIPLN